MNDQTNQLIEKLAEKLGTTAEHLWAVLVRQAPISSATELIALCIYAAVVIWGYRLVREKTKNGGDWCDDCGSVGLAWVMWSFGIMPLMAATCLCLPDIVAGFVNPEYWALKTLLGR